MKTASPDPNQTSFLYANLRDQLNPWHPLLKLARAIPRDHLESAVAPLYSRLGKPAKPIKVTTGSLAFEFW